MAVWWRGLSSLLSVKRASDGARLSLAGFVLLSVKRPPMAGSVDSSWVDSV